MWVSAESVNNDYESGVRILLVGGNADASFGWKSFPDMKMLICTKNVIIICIFCRFTRIEVYDIFLITKLRTTLCNREQHDDYIGTHEGLFRRAGPGAVELQF